MKRLNTDRTERVEPTGHAKSGLLRLGALVLGVLALVNSSERDKTPPPPEMRRFPIR
jgi:hypothetical protein